MPSRMHAARRATEGGGGGGGGCVAATLLGLSTCDAAAIKIHSCRGARRERQAGRQAGEAGGVALGGMARKMAWLCAGGVVTHARTFEG